MEPQTVVLIIVLVVVLIATSKWGNSPSVSPGDEPDTKKRAK